MIATLPNPTTPLPAAGPSPMTVAEFMRLYGDESHIELVKGRVKRLPRMPNPKHGRTCVLVSRYVDQFGEEKNLGRAVSNDSFVEVSTVPGSVRGPDVAFYSFSRLPKGDIPEGLLPCQPELVFEVKSPSNTWPELYEKVSEYLDSDILVVVLLDPVSRTAKIYRPGGREEFVSADGELTIPDVLPGFSVTMSRLFE